METEARIAPGARGKPYRPILLVGAAVLWAHPGTMAAQESEPDLGEGTAVELARPSLSATTLDGSLSVDGRLDEAAWANAEVATGFIQQTPVEGIPAEEETEVRVLVGDDAIYFGARMYESDPSLVDRRLVRRDQEGTYDYISISLDPNLDRRTGYYFRVTAANVQVDQYYYGDQSLDRNWNAVWESAVQHDDLGWTAEIRIPLSQIRYDAGDEPQTWGVNFARKRMATNETSFFSLRSRLRPGFVSQFGTLEDVQATGGSRRIEVRPYVLSSMHGGPAEEGNPFFDGFEASARTGGELRVGLGSSVTLDATINPDFGQVESDPAVINLSAFETRLEERRPFFVEDGQVFAFPMGQGPRSDEIFYSRRIGRAPVGGNPAGADFSDRPDDATILGAAKLTGRTSAGLSFGVLAAVTEEEYGDAYFVGEDQSERFMVEPRSQYGVVKLEQDFNQGASQLGGIVTGMTRSLPEDGSFDYLTSSAVSGGLTLDHQWNDRDWKLSLVAVGSHVGGDESAILRIQRSSNHYFQRPDATGLEVDSTATSMTGGMWRARLDRQNGEHWTGGVWLGESSAGLEVNDLGFSRATETVQAGVSLGYREVTPGSWYKSYNVNGWIAGSWSHEAFDRAGSWSSWEDARTSGTVNLMARSTFINDWNGDVNLSYSPDSYSYGATRGGPVMLNPGSWNLRANLNTDGRRTVSFRGGFNVRHSIRDPGSDVSVNGRIEVKPNSQLEISVSPRYQVQRVTDQYVTATSTLPFEPTFGRRYLFGDIERRTVSMQTRLDWTFSPVLSLQLYAQPLLSSGDYTRYKQLSAARSYDFDVFEPGSYSAGEDQAQCTGGSICTTETDGSIRQHLDFDGDGGVDYSFLDRDFNVRSLIGNVVLRWEYRPGSTIFFVWQRSQAGRVAVGDFDLSRDFDALLGAPADNRFMIKVNYWLGM